MSVFSFQGKEVLLDAGASSGKDKAMQTELFEVDPLSDNRKLYARAAEALGAGALVGIPTETVYGLGADALNPEAVARIFEAKGRPSFDPLIIHVHHGSEVEKYTAVPEGLKDLVHTLASRFWPGPLTMVYLKSSRVPNEVSAGLDTVAVRMPDNRTALALIRAAGVPIAAPSANLSGKPSPTTADHVKADMNGRIDVIIDGGPCNIGVESTVVSLMGGAVTILRPGGITREMLEAVIGPVNLSPAVLAPLKQGEAAASPGMKYKHYAPDAQVIVGTGSLPDMAAKLIAEYERREAEGLTCIIFATEETRCFYRGKRYVIIGERKNPLTLCESLFAQFRAQEDKADVILCEALPETDMGLAYMNRLLRSAGFKTI